VTEGPIAESVGNDLGERETGHPTVDTAVQAVAAAADLPPADQIEAYDAAHRTLQETLASIDES
jgi:hypothetical protein